MKPERTQFVAMLRNLVWGIFQTLLFETPEKAGNFTSFVLDMAENHDLDAACKFDETYTRVTLLVSANAGQEDAAEKFVEKTVAIYAAWSSDDEEITLSEEITPAEVN